MNGHWCPAPEPTWRTAAGLPRCPRSLRARGPTEADDGWGRTCRNGGTGTLVAG
jgi:hypothetical protein